MNTKQVDFKILWKVLPKVLVFISLSLFFFAVLNFFFSLFGVFLLQEPIQKIIFFFIFVGAFFIYTVKEYNLLDQTAKFISTLTIKISWVKSYQFYVVSIPELNISIFAKDIPEAFAKIENLIQSNLDRS